MRILLGKTGFLRQLDIDGAFDFIKAETDEVLHAHGIRGSIFVFPLLFAVHAFGNLNGLNIHRRNAGRLVDGYRPPNADRHALGILEGKYLPERPDIQPGFAGVGGVRLPILDSLHGRRCPLTEAAEAVVAPILRLDENGMPQILHPVADLPLDADIRDFTIPVQVCARTVSVQRVAVAVGAVDTDQRHKVDFVL